MRLRSLITIAALIAFMTAYAFAAMLVGIQLPTEGWTGWAVQALYYLIAGLVWLWPAAWLVRWGIR